MGGSGVDEEKREERREKTEGRVEKRKGEGESNDKGHMQMAKAKTRPGLARQDKERPDKARQEPRDVDHGRRHRLNALYVARAPPALKCVHVFGCPDTARQG